MSFTVGLAILAGAVSVGLRGYIRAAGVEQQRTLDRISLESAANATLGRMAAGQEVSLGTSVAHSERLNGRTLSIELSSPADKYDLRGDPETQVGDALKARGFGRPVRDIVDAGALETASRVWKLSSSQEDCLRRVLTFGRAPQALRTDLAQGGPERVFVAGAGDQVDLRLGLSAVSGPLALWVRARFTGQSSGWKLHDYRMLQLPERQTCSTV